MRQTESCKRDTARRLLELYGHLTIKLDRLMDLVERHDSQLSRMTQQYGEIQVSGGVRKEFGECIADLEEIGETLRATIGETEGAMLEICRTIDAVAIRRPEAAKALSSRYLTAGEPVRYSDIAKELGYSEDHVRRLCYEGLDIAADILGGK